MFQDFKSTSEKQLGSTAKRIEEFLAQFQNLDEAKEEEDTSGSLSKGLQKTDLYHLQKSLLEMKELRRTNKKQTRFEVLREKVVNFIDSLVREYLCLQRHSLCMRWCTLLLVTPCVNT